VIKKLVSKEFFEFSRLREEQLTQEIEELKKTLLSRQTSLWALQSLIASYEVRE